MAYHWSFVLNDVIFIGTLTSFACHIHIISISGSGGGILSVWREHTDKLELLQSQAISEQPVAALDWSPDKKGIKNGRDLSF